MDLKKNCAEEERLLCQPPKMLISSFTLENAILITPLLLFYLICNWGLLFGKYTVLLSTLQKKCFNSFVQSAVDSRRQGDENANSSVVAETSKFLANSSYGYQIMERSRQIVTKYLTNEKAHAANNRELFRKLDHVNNSLFEVELAEAQIEHKEPVIVGFFIIQYAKLRMLELYYNFFTRFCHVNKFEELEIETDSLHLALAEEELEDCIRPEMRAKWQRLRSNDFVDSFTANAVAYLFPRTCCVKHKQPDKREPGFFKEESRCTEMLCLCSKTYCCFDVISIKFKFSNKGLNKRAREQCGDGPLEMYQRVLNKNVNVNSNNRGFRTNNPTVATSVQLKKGLSYFYPKRIVETDAIHTQPLKM